AREHRQEIRASAAQHAIRREIDALQRFQAELQFKSSFEHGSRVAREFAQAGLATIPHALFIGSAYYIVGKQFGLPEAGTVAAVEAAVHALVRALARGKAARSRRSGARWPAASAARFARRCASRCRKVEPLRGSASIRWADAKFGLR